MLTLIVYRKRIMKYNVEDYHKLLITQLFHSIYNIEGEFHEKMGIGSYFHSWNDKHSYHIFAL